MNASLPKGPGLDKMGYYADFSGRKHPATRFRTLSRSERPRRSTSATADSLETPLKVTTSYGRTGRRAGRNFRTGS